MIKRSTRKRATEKEKSIMQLKCSIKILATTVIVQGAVLCLLAIRIGEIVEILSFTSNQFHYINDAITNICKILRQLTIG